MTVESKFSSIDVLIKLISLTYDKDVEWLVGSLMK